jgi:hypothetical protein
MSTIAVNFLILQHIKSISLISIQDILEILIIKWGKRENEIRTSPKNIAERMTEKNGSMALIVWVNETATFPRLILVKRFPKVCTAASGTIAASCQENAQK